MKFLKRFRKKSIISEEELIGDIVLLASSGFLSFMITFLFDIHHSFYTWPMHFDLIFPNSYPYLIFTPIGAILGLVIIKSILFGVKEIEK